MFFDAKQLDGYGIRLILEKTTEAVPEKGWAPAYHFAICSVGGAKMGSCQLRVGWNQGLYYSGHIGYAVDEAYRGHHYAGKACLLLFELARRHGMRELIITCSPDNIASAKTCEYAGGELVETVELPWDNPMRLEKGETHKCIYRVKLAADDAEIRQARAEELEECLEVIRKSFSTVAEQFGINRENCPAHTSFITIGHLTNQMKWGWNMLALHAGGRIVGYASVSSRDAGTCELHNVAVLPEYRHRGYGRLLLDRARECARARGAKRIVLGMIAEHTVLRRWYEANGFVFTGEKKFAHLPFTTGFMEWREEKET